MRGNVKTPKKFALVLGVRTSRDSWVELSIDRGRLTEAGIKKVLRMIESFAKGNDTQAPEE